MDYTKEVIIKFFIILIALLFIVINEKAYALVETTIDISQSDISTNLNKEYYKSSDCPFDLESKNNPPKGDSEVEVIEDVSIDKIQSEANDINNEYDKKSIFIAASIITVGIIMVLLKVYSKGFSYIK